MSEPNFPSAKAFNPASFTMPAQPSLTYTVIAGTNRSEISSYVQTVFHRPLGTQSPGATLTDQAPPAIRTAQGMRSARQDQQPYDGAQTNGFAQQPPVTPTIHSDSQFQRSSLRLNLSDQATGLTDAKFIGSDQTQSFAPPADHSNLPYVPRTKVGLKQQADSSPSVLNWAHKVQEKDTQNPAAKEPQVSTSKTTLVDLRQGSAQSEIPQRDQNTIAEKPDGFLKRVAFSNKFSVTPSGEQKVEKAKPTGKIIYLKSVSPEELTAKLKLPTVVQEEDHQPIAETEVTRLPEPAVESAVPQPQIIKWPIVDSGREGGLFPAPVSTPKEADVVSAGKPIDTATTKIDFTEVNSKAVVEPEMAEPETDQSTVSTFNPFATTDAPDYPLESAPAESFPFKSTPVESASVASSPFESAPVESSPFESSPFESSPFESAPAQSSPLDTAPVQSSPFGTTPSQTSPFQPSPSSSPFESSDGADLSESKFDVTQSQPKTFTAIMTDFTEASPPEASESSVSTKKVSVSDLDSASVEESANQVATTKSSKITSQVSKPSAKPQNATFRVAGHRSVNLKSESSLDARKFKSSDSEANQPQRSKIILPEFKPSVAAQADHHLTASTLQIGHRSDAKGEQQFDTPWLSPWWMLIGLIPIAIYFGTQKYFRDEDEYHSHKNELFGSRLNFEGDFDDLGKSKSDTLYGGRDEVATVKGPSGEVVRFDDDVAQSPIEFAQSLDFELPSSEDVAQSSVGQELQIDQSPNFSQSSPSANNPKMLSAKKTKKSNNR